LPSAASGMNPNCDGIATLSQVTHVSATIPSSNRWMMKREFRQPVHRQDRMSQNS
jgi:hypothetical protein